MGKQSQQDQGGERPCSCGVESCDDTQWIQCDQCSCWYHGVCQNFNKTEVNYISKLSIKGVKWECKKCVKRPGNELENKVSAIEESVKRMEQLLKEHGVQTETRLQTFEKTYSAVVKENVENMCDKLQTTATSTQAMLTQQLQDKEQEARKNNAIIYSLTETEDSEDTQDTVAVFLERECFQDTCHPIESTRLGKKKEQPRPIKVRFNNEQEKWQFVKRVNAMKIDGVFCKLDSSKATRNDEWALRERVRELRAKDDSIHYRIRDMAIQQQSESGDWEKMNPASSI